MQQDKLAYIANRFNIQGTITNIKPLGNGLINTTYKVTTSAGSPDYVMQRINTSIFTNPDMLMHNIVLVTNHIRHKLSTTCTDDIDRKCLQFVTTNDNKYYYRHDDGGCWRMMKYIPDTVSKSGVSPESAYIVGKTFGEFQNMLSDIPETLGDTIKDFHNMEFRLQQLNEAISSNPVNRLSDVSSIVAEISSQANEMCRGEQLYREGLLPKRICHCDTKVDNILFDQDGKVLCVIDLDTVMPNFVFSDYGDFLRSAANTSREDEPDITKVSFRIDIFQSFTKGYIESAKAFLTETEIANLPFATQLFSYMQAVRFLSDYLNGDTYYRIKYPEHNLVRTKAQYQLFLSAKSHTREMQDYISTLL